MIRKKLSQALESTQYLELIHDAKNVTSGELKLLTNEYEKYRGLFLQGGSEINDDEDLAYYIAVKYVEVKANWIQQNLRLNYQAVFKGSADQVLLVQTALLSHFLSRVEPIVDQKHLAMIQELLSQRLAA